MMDKVLVEVNFASKLLLQSKNLHLGEEVNTLGKIQSTLEN
jgi:hypothetical protein